MLRSGERSDAAEIGSGSLPARMADHAVSGLGARHRPVLHEVRKAAPRLGVIGQAAMSITVYQIGRPIGPFAIIQDFRTDPRTAWAPKPAVVKKQEQAA